VVQVGTQRVFVVHAGLSFEDITLQDVNNENRFCLSFDMNSILQDLLWSDPYSGSGRMLSKRGAGCQFGADVCARFLVRNKLQLLIRSHECEDNGYNLWFDNRCYSIFSASDYCGDSGNYGAFCTLSGSPAPQIRVFMAKKQVLSYSDRQRRVRQQVLSKLLVRLTCKVFQLENALQAHVDDQGTCSLIAWSVTMQDILGVDAPFLCIANKLGVDTSSKRMHVQTWCDKFKPAAATDTELEGATAGDLLRRKIAALLFDTTSPFVSGLELLFEHFDSDKDGSISTQEFKSGLQTLMMKSTH
jgi:diadenosine tetraphosphatase ApaH/serine/threonine PP2A family protein phosphatase